MKRNILEVCPILTIKKKPKKQKANLQIRKQICNLLFLWGLFSIVFPSTWVTKSGTGKDDQRKTLQATFLGQPWPQHPTLTFTPVLNLAPWHRPGKPLSMPSYQHL